MMNTLTETVPTLDQSDDFTFDEIFSWGNVSSPQLRYQSPELPLNDQPLEDLGEPEVSPLVPNRETSSKIDYCTDTEGDFSVSFDPKSSTTAIPQKVGLDDFEILRLVGRGGYGKVHQVRKKNTNQIYAMKVMRKEYLVQTNNVSYTISERNIMRNVRHPFVASLHYAFQTKGKVYLVMDFLNGGPLLNHMRRASHLSEDFVRFYAAELILALEYLHSLDIIHRDLKPENIMITQEGHLALADFGLAKVNVTEKDSAKTICGTVEYMAPEIIRCVGHGKAVDWWSLGILIYDMMTGHPPFRARQRNILQKEILKAEVKIPRYVSQQASSLITALLNPIPEKRLGFRGAHEIKSHEFFAEIQWDKLLKQELAPPFTPDVRDGLLDTTYFDSKLLKVQPGDSPLDDCPLLEADFDLQFSGFSFVSSSVESIIPEHIKAYL